MRGVWVGAHPGLQLFVIQRWSRGRAGLSQAGAGVSGLVCRGALGLGGLLSRGAGGVRVRVGAHPGLQFSVIQPWSRGRAGLSRAGAGVGIPRNPL